MGNRSERGAAPADLLLVEDDRREVRLMEEALRDGSITNTLHSVTTGDDALDFVRQRGDFEDAPRPDLIFLDWHLPAVNGDEILVELADDADLGSITVVVLTDSESERAIIESETIHPAAYLTRPVDAATLLETIRSTEEFWLTVVERPLDE